jgi:hypothetical protein
VSLVAIKATGSTDTLATLSVDTAGRGGIIAQDGTAFTVNYPAPVTVVGLCYPAGKADYAQWVAVGSPTCWCYTRQCRGDADNATQNPSGKAAYWVYTNDLAVLSAGWAKTGIVASWICADFAHDSQNPSGKAAYRVYTNDLTRLSANWAKTNVPPDCLNLP